MKIKRIMRKIVLKLYAIPFSGALAKIWNFVNAKSYMKSFANYLKFCGVVIEGEPSYISPDVYFDSHDYSKIKIGNHSVLSREVMLLTHDYSLTRGLEAIKKNTWGGGIILSRENRDRK